MQRVLVMAGYFLRALVRSVVGIVLILLTFAYWLILFNPGQGTPDPAYYVIVIGVFGAVMAFVSTLAVASRANQAEMLPWLVRLPSRVEYMTAVFLATILFTIILQGVLALLALYRGPDLSLMILIELPPVWLPFIILASVLALHATDLIAAGWSRVYVFGILALLLFFQSFQNATLNSVITSLNRLAIRQGWRPIMDSMTATGLGLNNSDSNVFSFIFGLIFWPFRAINEAVISGSFSTAQALAPAILLLYATILFMLAADLFANKDLTFSGVICHGMLAL